MFQDCLWRFVCCDQLQQRSWVANKPQSHKLFLLHIFSLKRKRRKVVRRVGPTCYWHDALQPRFKLVS